MRNHGYSMGTAGALLLTAFVLFLFTAALCGDVADGNEAVPPTPGTVWKNPPQKVMITDQLRAVLHRDTSSKVTIIRFFAGGGMRGETPGKKGTAFMTTRLAVEFSGPSDVRNMSVMGATSLSWVEADHSFITIECLSEHLEETLKIFMKTMKNPLFSNLRMPNIKRNMEHREKGEDDSPEDVMKRESLNAFFGDGPYGGSIYGDETSRKKIKRKDLSHFYKTYFSQGNMVVVVSSDMETDELQKILKKHLKVLPEGPAVSTFTPVTLREVNERELAFHKDTTQVLVSLSAPLPPASARNYALAQLLETLLGDGIGSKLWPLRSERNLAYHIGARATHMKERGVLRLLLKTGTENKERARQALKDIVASLAQKGIDAREWRVILTRARMAFLRNNETKDKRTYNMGLFEMLGGEGMDAHFVEGFFKQLETLTLDEFNTYMKDVLKPENMLEITVGPGKQANKDAGE